MSSAEQLKHQRDLSVVAELVAADVRTEARKADPGDIDGWWRARGPKIQATVAEGFTTTAAMGAKRLAASALAAGLELDPVSVAVELAQLAVSLRVTGPVAFKTQMSRSGSPDAAMRVMTDRLTGSARRLTLAGDRETFWATADASPLLIGYRRVARAGACKFCEMLAGRGAVYLSAASAGTVVGRGGRPRGNRDLGRSFHDGCDCRIEEIWDENARPAPPSPPPARAFEDEERERARADRLRRKANVERIKAEAAAQRAALREGRAEAIGTGKVDPEVLTRWGVTEDLYLTARAMTAEIKADIRKVARAEADNLGDWLFNNDLSQLSRPDRLRRTTNFAGAQVSRRNAAGYDWLEQLDDAELGQVRRRMVDGDLYRPDLLAEVVRAKTNTNVSDDEAMQWLVDRWLHEDALRSLASGRLPRYADPDNLIPSDYSMDGYQLGRLFGVADEDAIGHVAQVQADAARTYAGRVLGQPRFGPAPWEMDAADYVAELEDVERILADTQLAPGIDPGPDYRWARDRIRELAPVDLEVPPDANPYDLHEAIRITAQLAGRLQD